MELTYENMKARVEEYWGLIPTIEGPQYESKMREFYTPDFRSCWDDPPIIRNREEILKQICGHGDVYRCYHTFHPTLGIMIDERRKIATLFWHVEFKNPVTGKHVTPSGQAAKAKTSRIAIWELCLHENKIKIRREVSLVVSDATAEALK